MRAPLRLTAATALADGHPDRHAALRRGPIHQARRPRPKGRSPPPPPPASPPSGRSPPPCCDEDPL
eukprot:5471729-Pyramimonas_sp.AAC.1